MPIGSCSLTGRWNARPLGPSSTGLRSLADVFDIPSDDGSGAFCTDEMLTATEFPGGSAPGSICSAAPCTGDSGASTETVAPFGFLGSIIADVSTTGLAASIEKLCVAVLPSMVALTLKSCLPPCASLGVQVRLPPWSIFAPAGAAFSVQRVAPGFDDTAWYFSVAP